MYILLLCDNNITFPQKIIYGCFIINGTIKEQQVTSKGRINVCILGVYNIVHTENMHVYVDD